MGICLAAIVGPISLYALTSGFETSPSLDVAGLSRFGCFRLIRDSRCILYICVRWSFSEQAPTGVLDLGGADLPVTGSTPIEWKGRRRNFLAMALSTTCRRLQQRFAGEACSICGLRRRLVIWCTVISSGPYYCPWEGNRSTDTVPCRVRASAPSPTPW